VKPFPNAIQLWKRSEKTSDCPWYTRLRTLFQDVLFLAESNQEAREFDNIANSGDEQVRIRREENAELGNPHEQSQEDNIA
tara:strand:- start:172 stop:414 length:243 start_codon:yes stop_codon:yes gene_type:complete